ncbi:uncharacterized protein [Drosophila takahashii]|uniref:uncharacterized protein n=1 Tax=Drosophila takahashii TaxID=29030 RepID=UPI001CF90E50|nr:uncharacterized protein LOC123003138 [Drosophila takahashii]
MDSAQTAQCILYSVVVCVLLLIVGFLIFIVNVYVLGPAVDEMELRLIEFNGTTAAAMDPDHDYDNQ